MSQYFTVEDEQQKMFTQMPKALLYEERYKQMTNDAKLLYSFLTDRVSNSLKNKWIDANKQVYIRCSEIAMGEILNKSEKTARKFKNELIEKGLLESANDAEDKTKWYVKKPLVTVEKLEQYIDGFNSVVNEKRSKENVRNKEYRIKKAQGKITSIKQSLCNGNNDRSIENTNIQGAETLEPLQTLATVEITDCDQSKLPFSNNDFSNTDFLGMYVSTPAWEETETPFIQLAKKNQITFSEEMRSMVMSYEEVFSYDLYEYLFFDILNKYRNGKVQNFEKYLLTAMDGQASRQQFTLSDYLDYKSEFSAKNYPRKDFANPNYKKPATKTVPEVKIPEEPKFVPSFEVPATPVVPAEELPAPDFAVEERMAIFNFRRVNNLLDSKYQHMSLQELQAVKKQIDELHSKVDEVADTYNKDIMDLETRRRYARVALGLDAE